MDKSQILGSALFLFLVGQGCYFLLGKILFLIEKATYFWFFSIISKNKQLNAKSYFAFSKKPKNKLEFRNLLLKGSFSGITLSTTSTRLIASKKQTPIILTKFNKFQLNFIKVP